MGMKKYHKQVQSQNIVTSHFLSWKFMVSYLRLLEIVSNVILPTEV